MCIRDSKSTVFRGIALRPWHRAPGSMGAFARRTSHIVGTSTVPNSDTVANGDTPRRKGVYNWYDEGAEYFTEITSPKQFDDVIAETAAENPDKLIVIEFYTRYVGYLSVG
eukprot:5055713-Pyramimonas_sp.AAC.1